MRLPPPAKVTVPALNVEGTELSTTVLEEELPELPDPLSSVLELSPNYPTQKKKGLKDLV